MGGIEEALKELLGNPAGGTFLTVLWDGAHSYERVAGDVFADKHGNKVTLESVDWILTIADKTSAYNNLFCYGNGNQEAKDLANELAATFRDPIKMCDARFLQYNVRAISTFLDSFKVMAAWYEEASTIPAGARTGKKGKGGLRTERNAEEKRYYELWCAMRDGAFIGRLLIMRDALSPMVEVSLAAQKVNTWPPELREKELALLARMKRMAGDLYVPDKKDRRPMVLREADWPLLHARAAPDGPSVWEEFEAALRRASCSWPTCGQTARCTRASRTSCTSSNTCG